MGVGVVVVVAVVVVVMVVVVWWGKKGNGVGVDRGLGDEVGCGRVVAVHHSVAAPGPPQRGSLLSAVCRSRWLRANALLTFTRAAACPRWGAMLGLSRRPLRKCPAIRRRGLTKSEPLHTLQKLACRGRGLALIRVGARSRRAACSQAEEAHELGQ